MIRRRLEFEGEQVARQNLRLARRVRELEANEDRITAQWMRMADERDALATRLRELGVDPHEVVASAHV